eukprot:g10993.t1
MFLLDAEAFGAALEDKGTDSAAGHAYDLYVQIVDKYIRGGSPYEVNIECKTRSKVLRATDRNIFIEFALIERYFPGGEDAEMLFKVAWVLSVACAVGASSSQRNYDGSNLSYDPKGRMIQVEYAKEATWRGRTVIGVCGEGCVVLVTRDSSPPSSCRAVGGGRGLWAVNTHVSIAAFG